MGAETGHGTFLTQIFLPLIAAYLMATILGPFVIRFLQREHAAQTERGEGPESHKKKSGTPTMGGVIFLVPAAVISLFYAKSHPEILAVLVLTVGFGIVGFVDDYIKVVKKRNLGLRAWQKLVGQTIAVALFAVALRYLTEVEWSMRLPFFADYAWAPGMLFLPALLLIALATANGTNFTDGVDGLCASVTSVVAAFFILATMVLSPSLTPLAAAFLGGLLGYLFFNVFPGRVMMGDTGSLAIGGFVTGVAFVARIPLFIPLFGVIYALEVLSVVLQVSYFKLTHGKRIFRMSPIHHHFELGGWSETRVVNGFTTITVIGCLTALLAL